MEVINNYYSYLSKFGNGEAQCVFYSEVDLLKLIALEGENLPKEPFCLWDNLNDKEQAVLLKVVYDGVSLRILEGHPIERSLGDVAHDFGIDNLENAKKWWDLCYYRDKHGLVHYDPYYDKFFSANETDKRMSDLCEELSRWIDSSFIEKEGLMYLLGEIAICNPMVYLLQQKGLEVKTIQGDDFGNKSEVDACIEFQRKRLAVPYGNGDRVTLSFFTSEGIGHNLALCQHPYVVTIPIDLVDINDNAIGNCTFKDIVPTGKFCHDYTCCGHNYCYLELELFADLHGNTILKATDSNEIPKFTIINKFDYSNMHEYGETN